MIDLVDLKDKLKKQLTIHEARMSQPYKDTVGKWTWGVGRNLSDVPLNLDETLILLTKGKERAIDLCLDNDIERCFKDLDKYIPYWKSHAWPRAGVLVNMCFNLGIRRLLTFTNTLRSFEEGDYDGTARNMSQSKWHRQVGRRAPTLEHIMRTNEWIEGYTDET